MSERHADLNCSFELKAQAGGDADSAVFTGVASTSDTDLQNEIIAAGAFDPISTKMSPDGDLVPDVMLLRDHDRSQVIGGWRSFKQDGDKLLVEGELCLDVPKARETYVLMKKGYLTGLSVGYTVRDPKGMVVDQRTGKRIVKKGELKECSIVSFPANREAKIIHVKAELDDWLSERGFKADDLAGLLQFYAEAKDDLAGLLQLYRAPAPPESSAPPPVSSNNSAVRSRTATKANGVDDTADDAATDADDKSDLDRWLEEHDLDEAALNELIALLREEGRVKEERWVVGGGRDLPIAETERAWDAAAARNRVFAHANIGTDNGTPNVALARRAFLIYDAANPENRGSYSLPFADIVNGELKVIPSALRAAASRLPQVTGVSQDVLDRARRILDRYFAKLQNGDTEKSVGRLNITAIEDDGPVITPKVAAAAMNTLLAELKGRNHA